MIDVGESTARVSRLMGHANEAITGAVYAHEIERRDGGEKTRAAMRAAFSPEDNPDGTADRLRTTPKNKHANKLGLNPPAGV